VTEISGLTETLGVDFL